MDHPERDHELLINFLNAWGSRDYTLALSLTTKMLDSSQWNHSIAFCNRADCYYQLGLYRKCISDCNQALKLDSKLSGAYLRKGSAYLMMGKNNMMEDTFREGLQKSEGHVQTLILFQKYLSLENQHLPVDFNQYESHLNSKKTQQCDNTHHLMNSNTNSFKIKDQKLENGKKMTFFVDPLSQQTSKNSSLLLERSSKNSSIPLKPEYFSVINHLDQNKLDIDQIGKILKLTGSNMIDHASGNLNVDQIIAYGYLQVNIGNLDSAIPVFTSLLESYPNTLAGHLGLGTALALSGQIELATSSFSKALDLDPNCIDAYKRRSQTLSALGRDLDAIKDLDHALEKTKNFDLFFRRAQIYIKIKNYQRSLIDLKRAGSLEHGNSKLWHLMGICYNSLGKMKEAVESFLKSIAVDPKFVSAYTAMAQAYLSWGNEVDALNYLDKVLLIDPNYDAAYHLKGIVYFGMGFHFKAIPNFLRVIQIESQSNPIDRNAVISNSMKEGECSTNHQSSFDAKWMLAVTLHGLGKVKEAIQAYNLVLEINPDYVCWYQREISLYWHHHLDQDMSHFNIQHDLTPEFKESWCKFAIPSPICRSNVQPPISPSIEDVSTVIHLIHYKQLKTKNLIDYASNVGQYLHQDAPGFLMNRRQIRMAGFAIIELSQTLHRVWTNLRSSLSNSCSISLPLIDINSSNQNWIQSIETISSQSSSLKGPHPFGWRDMFDILIKWRQYSEPNDPIWWVDLLTSKQFNEGFGSQTPIILGQCHVVRYGSMFNRTLPLFKSLMKEQHVLTKEKLEKLEKAQTIEELYQIMETDIWVLTPCHSIATPGKVMEGTRLTLNESKDKEGYEYHIRTPGTPTRWIDYKAELDYIFHQLCWEQIQPKPDLEKCTYWIMAMTYYWYNFMPLSRGTAATGYMAMLSMFMACGYQIKAKIPPKILLDWDAILLPTFSEFYQSAHWIYPHCVSINQDTFNQLPLVSKEFNTLREMIAVLNHTVKNGE